MPTIKLQTKQRRKTIRLPEFEYDIIDEIAGYLFVYCNVEKPFSKALCIIVREFYWNTWLPMKRRERFEMVMQEAFLQYNIKRKARKTLKTEK